MTSVTSVNEPTDLDDINRLGIAFCQAKVVLAAIELELFTVLGGEGAGQAEICERVGLHPRAVRDFLSALVCFGLLRFEDGRYFSTETARRYLDKKSTEYGGAFLERANRMMYPAWTGLAGLLRNGRPQLEGREDQSASFQRMMADPDHLRNFLRMMDAVSGPLGPELASAFDWGAHRTVLDVGGARGNLLAQVLQAHPHLQGTVFDLPPIAPLFVEHMPRFGVEDRASFSPGNFFQDQLPMADVVMTGHVLHDWDADERAQLIKTMAESVNPGGTLLIYDQLLEEHPVDPWNTLISLNMQLISSGGAEYTLAECTEWLRAAGLSEPTTVALGSHDTLVIAHKPARPGSAG